MEEVKWPSGSRLFDLVQPPIAGSVHMKRTECVGIYVPALFRSTVILYLNDVTFLSSTNNFEFYYFLYNFDQIENWLTCEKTTNAFSSFHRMVRVMNRPYISRVPGLLFTLGFGVPNQKEKKSRKKRKGSCTWERTGGTGCIYETNLLQA